MTVAEEMYEALGRFREDDTSGDLRKLTEALSGNLQLINDIVAETEDGRPGWASAMDLDLAPTSVLPWLAQFVGVTITPGMSDEEARQAIRTPDGFAVGTIAAIRSAAERTLTGTKRVVIHENTPDLGYLYVRTIASETPDPAATEAAIRSQKPWHVVLEYEATDGFSYIDLAAMFDTYDDLDAADLTYDEVSELTP